MKKNIFEIHPSLFKEWCSDLNKDIDPKSVALNSNKKVYWKCKNNPQHIWKTSFAHRNAGTGCPYCKNQKILPSNSLASINQKLAKEWHPSLNKHLSPEQVSPGSDKIVWWQCPDFKDHIYKAKISSRNRGAKCSVCAGRVVVKSNSLSYLFPKISEEWHPTKNKKKPEDVTSASNQSVYWICKTNSNHIWKTKISNRTLKNQQCPYCNKTKASEEYNLESLFPKLIEEWDFSNNDIPPSEILPNSAKSVWWKCKINQKHSWKAKVYSRTRYNYACPFCAGRVADENNNLVITHPEIAKEWNFEKNRKDPTEYKAGSNVKVWWKCKKGNDHIWLSSINNRTNGKNCPICSGQKVVESTMLTTTHPDIANEWNYRKNGKLKPENYHAGSSKSVWWKCEKGDDHEWKTEIRVRTSGNGCPICSNRIIVNSNCLQTTHPKIASEFHKAKNENLTPLIIGAGSNKKVWWQCRHNPTHEWKTVITSRTSIGTGCPYCSLTPQSKEELIILFELKEIFKEIEVKNYKIKFGNRIYSFDIFIPSLNQIIEYDGSHWHKDNQQTDKRKVEIARSNSINVFRVRQKPLKKITNDDLVVNEKFDGKKYVDIILNKILHLHHNSITSSQKKKIETYFKSTKTKAGKKLEKYIDNILKESNLKIGEKNGR